MMWIKTNGWPVVSYHTIPTLSLLPFWMDGNFTFTIPYEKYFSAVDRGIDDGQMDRRTNLCTFRACLARRISDLGLHEVISGFKGPPKENLGVVVDWMDTLCTITWFRLLLLGTVTSILAYGADNILPNHHKVLSLCTITCSTCNNCKGLFLMMLKMEIMPKMLQWHCWEEEKAF